MSPPARRQPRPEPSIKAEWLKRRRSRSSTTSKAAGASVTGSQEWVSLVDRVAVKWRRDFGLLVAGLLAASCAAGPGSGGEALVINSEPITEELTFSDEPDTDCDTVPDTADAYPLVPNDFAEFGWEASNGGWTGSGSPPVEQWPLVEYWWNEPAINRCDLDADGVVDSTQLDPATIEDDARRFGAAVRAEQARWEATELERDLAESQEAQRRDRVAEQEREHCQAAVEDLYAAINTAHQQAETGGWSDASQVAYDQAIEAAQAELDEFLDGLTEISGC